MKNERKLIIIGLLLITVILLVTACSSDSSSSSSENNNGGDVDKDNEENILTFSSYPVGSVAYTETAAISDTFQSKDIGLKLRNVPVDSEIARFTGVKDGQADVAVFGAGSSYFLFNGMLDFASPDIGPQPVRQVWLGAAFGQTFITTKDSGIEELKDIKGKRVPYIAGGPTANYVMEAALAFADLSFDDVELVDFPGLASSWDALKSGAIDVTWGGPTAAPFMELASSPKGIHYPEFPVDDTEGWERMQKLAPFHLPVEETTGANLSEDNPVNINGVAYPYLLVMKDKDEEIVYELTKAIHENFDEYKDVHPLMPLWEIDQAITVENMITPFHEGSIRYFEEIGHWNEEFEQKQEQLLEDEKKLQELWEEMKQEGIDDEDEFKEQWEMKRAEAFN